jgi:hypothetical protein
MRVSICYLQGSALPAPEDKALKKISGPNMEEINERPTDGLLRDCKIHGIHRPLSIVRIVTSRSLRWARHMSRLEGKRNACRILVRNPLGKCMTETTEEIGR